MTAALSPLDVIILAVVQGLTEFLPVSSSGHLVLADAALGLRQPGIALELVLHLGTLGAVLLYYRRDIVRLAVGAARFAGGRRGREERSAAEMVLLLALGTVPAVAGALLFGDFLKSTFENARQASIDLGITGLVLLATRFARPGGGGVGRRDSLLVGLAQMVAILPGISRSGTTIATALFRGVRPDEAARFSFLLSIPAILGGVLFDAREITAATRDGGAGLYLLGFGVAFGLGYASIAWLLRIVRRGRFASFGFYCLAASAVGLFLLSR